MTTNTKAKTKIFMKKRIVEIFSSSITLALYPLFILNQIKALNLTYNSMPFFIKRKIQKHFSHWKFSKSFIWKIKLLNGKYIKLNITSNKDWFNALAFYNYAPELCHIEDLIAKYLNTNSHYIDIGANNGHRSFRMLSEQRLVHLIDANPGLCQNLLELMDLNNFKNYKIQNYGISDTECELPFYVHERNSMSSFVKPENHKVLIKEELKIKCITLDDYFEKNNIKNNLNFIKIDVEGLEKKVVKGGLKVITSFNNIFLIEIALESDKKELLMHFKNKGYTVFGLNWGISNITVEISSNHESLSSFFDFLFIKNINENKSIIETVRKI